MMTINSSQISQIRSDQLEDLTENVKEEGLKGMGDNSRLRMMEQNIS